MSTLEERPRRTREVYRVVTEASCDEGMNKPITFSLRDLSQSLANHSKVRFESTHCSPDAKD